MYALRRYITNICIIRAIPQMSFESGFLKRYLADVETRLYKCFLLSILKQNALQFTFAFK